MSKVLALDPTVELSWYPKCDEKEPEDQRLILRYKNLTARQEAEINDQMIKSISKGKKSEYNYRVSSADLKRCVLSIVGWENFKYADNHPIKAGKDVPFEKDNIGLIPGNIRSEFVTFLTNRDEDDENEGETDLGEAKTE